MIYLDTHVVVWMYQDAATHLSLAAREAITASRTFLISPMVHLEIGYLREIRRIEASPDAILGSLQATIGLRICDLPWSAVAEQALALTWTRDPFDRLITAHAMLAKAILVTHDSTIRANYAKAVW